MSLPSPYSHRGRTELATGEPSFPETPEGDLWLAVIRLAFLDAKTESPAKSAAFLRWQARAWLSGDSADFRAVCRLAGLDPTWVADLALSAGAVPPVLGSRLTG